MDTRLSITTDWQSRNSPYSYHAYCKEKRN
ncbi:hypothetical protein IAE33_000747 [Pseudomonas sp. S60]|nr:hypothetical protein [Pseudomonas sp. S60]